MIDGMEEAQPGVAVSRAGRGREWGVRMLVAGGVLSALNGTAHFLLPVIYPWGEHVDGLYEPVRWALFATTVFFAVLLVLVGALTVAVARSARLPRWVVAAVAGGMAGFWLVGAVYEIVEPFPAAGADVALPVFSGVVAALHLAGMVLVLGAGERRSR